MEREGVLYLDAEAFMVSIPLTYAKTRVEVQKNNGWLQPQHVEVKSRKEKGFLKGMLLGIERLGTEMFGHLPYGDKEIMLMSPPRFRSEQRRHGLLGTQIGQNVLLRR